MTTLKRESGSYITLGRGIRAGGQGEIYAVVGEPHLVAKIYFNPTQEDANKLQRMLTKPPIDPTRKQGHISIAWPIDQLFDTQGKFVGFLMPYIDHDKNVPLLKLYNQQSRLQTLPGFTWKYLLQTASNLTSIVAALHASGYVIGDLNERNIYVSTSALVTLIDCDSMQIPHVKGKVFRCPVGSADYTPPELQGRDFVQIDRTTSHDNFGLAVLIFLLLMEGRHPFETSLQGVGIPPTRAENIQKGNFPYAGRSSPAPPRSALPFDTLPVRLQTLMVRCFVDGQCSPQQRPTAREWNQALSDVEQQLTSCRVNGQHWYSRHLSSCPWCIRMRSGIPDPFPPLKRQAIAPPRSTNPQNVPSSVTPRPQSPVLARPRAPAPRGNRRGILWITGLVALLLILSVWGISSHLGSTTTPVGNESSVTTSTPTHPTPRPTPTTTPSPIPANVQVNETLTVPFVNGPNGATTANSYAGSVTIRVSGYGQAAAIQFSDAFYIFTDSAGNPITPVHPDDFHFSLCINNQSVNIYVPQTPLYRSDHTYQFTISVGSSPQQITFGICDTYTVDNSGNFTVTVKGTSSQT